MNVDPVRIGPRAVVAAICLVWWLIGLAAAGGAQTPEHGAQTPEHGAQTPERGAQVLEAVERGTAQDAASVPLLLVPGWGDFGSRVEPLRRRFVEAGWGETRVSVMDFSDPFGSNRAHAKELARAVEIKRRLTGAERIDIVAHSMGGLAVRQYLRFEGGAEQVRRVVFLGTPHRGTMAAILAWGDGGREMVPGSDFLTRLNAEEGRIPDGVQALAIRSPTDLRVIPASSGILAGSLNLEICCPTHQQLLDGGTQAFEQTVRFLRDGPSGVPRASIALERTEWAEQERLGPWTLWGDGWAEELVRRWLLPSWRSPDPPNRHRERSPG